MWVIDAALPGLMLAANAWGFRMGRQRYWGDTELSRTVASAFKVIETLHGTIGLRNNYPTDKSYRTLFAAMDLRTSHYAA